MKKRHIESKLDVYTELCPASAMAIIGCGLITMTMGEYSVGVALACTGLVIGVAGPVTRTILERKFARR